MHYKFIMGYFLPCHRSLIVRSSEIAEEVVLRGINDPIRAPYDVKTLKELENSEREQGVFAKLVYAQNSNTRDYGHYRICLQDDEILNFLNKNKDIDLLTFLVFIFTHELIHIHRFSTGKASFFDLEKHKEEVHVDNLTRILLAKNPLCGMGNVLKTLDRVSPPPLYKTRILLDNGGHIHAYL